MDSVLLKLPWSSQAKSTMPEMVLAIGEFVSALTRLSTDLIAPSSAGRADASHEGRNGIGGLRRRAGRAHGQFQILDLCQKGR